MNNTFKYLVFSLLLLNTALATALENQAGVQYNVMDENIYKYRIMDQLIEHAREQDAAAGVKSVQCISQFEDAAANLKCEVDALMGSQAAARECSLEELNKLLSISECRKDLLSKIPPKDYRLNPNKFRGEFEASCGTPKPELFSPACVGAIKSLAIDPR